MTGPEDFSYLDSHDELWAALAAPRIDFRAIERIVRHKRLAAIDPVLDTVERIKDSHTRERLLDLLAELGDDVGPYVVRRLDAARPDLRRALFLQLGKLNALPPDFDASRFLLHEDASVRREAMRVLLKYVETREQAIIAGLADTDEQTTFLALTAAHEGGCSAAAVRMARERLETGALHEALITLAVRVIAAADSRVGPMLSGRGRASQMMRAIDPDRTVAAGRAKKTYDKLVGTVASKSIFGRWKLRPKSPYMLAALGALSTYWSHDPVVRKIVALAVKSGDLELRRAMSAPRASGQFKTTT